MQLRHPLLIPLMALIAGLLICFKLQLHLPLWSIFIATGLLVSTALLKNRYLFSASLALFWLCWGVISLAPYSQQTPSNSVKYFVQQTGVVTFEGIVTSRPANLPEGHRFRLHVERLLTDQGWVAIDAVIQVTVATGQGEWLTGDRVMVRGTVRIPQRLGLPGEFDYGRYLALRGVEAVSWVKDSNNVVLIRAKAKPSFRRDLDRIAQRVDRVIRNTLPDRAVHTVLMALVTGSQLEIPQTLVTAYGRAGVSHILSISGFHLAVVSAAVVMILASIGLRWEWLALRCNIRRTALILTLPLMLVYLLFTGAAPATVRSVVMLMAVVLALWAERESDVLDALILAAFVLLLLSPAVLFDLSFQLSFLSLWGIVVLTPILISPFEKCLSGWGRIVAMSSAASLSAVLATAVASLYTFHQASLTGLLANLVVVPLLGYGAVLLGSAAVPFVFVAPRLAEWLFMAAGWMIDISNRFIILVSDIPVFRSYQFGALEFSLSIAALAAFSFVSSRNVRISSLALLLIIAIIHQFWPAPKSHNQLQMTFLSVGQAESTLIRMPDASTMLIDGGGYLHNNSRDFGERYLVPALHALGVKRIDRMVLTHPHPDHIGGLPAVAEQFPVGELWQGAWHQAGPDYERLRSALKRRGTVIRQFSGTESLSYAGASIRIWSPSISRTEKQYEAGAGNEESLVLRVQYKDFSALMMGDAGLETEQKLLKQGISAATLLKVGHHGSKTATGNDFLTRVKPRIAVISAGKANRFGLPTPDVIRRLSQHRIAILRTDLDGTVLVVSDGAGFRTAKNYAGR